jgi:predicted nucleic acid-binding protein
MSDTFVIDCSVAAKWILPEPGQEAALSWFNRYVAGEVLLIAPDILVAEFASLLAKHHRRKMLTAVQARDAFAFMTKLSPRLFQTRPRLARALDLSVKSHLSLWDCVYLVLAQEHDCSVLTADARLFRGGTANHAPVRLLQ